MVALNFHSNRLNESTENFTKKRIRKRKTKRKCRQIVEQNRRRYKQRRQILSNCRTFRRHRRSSRYQVHQHFTGCIFCENFEAVPLFLRRTASRNNSF
jgi:hypothetical protein